MNIGKKFNIFFKKLFEILKINNENEPVRLAAKIAIIYLIIGALWIFATDRLVILLASEKSLILFINILKGWAYVILTSVLVFFVIYNNSKRVRNSEIDVVKSYKEVKRINEELYATQEELKGQNDQLKKSESNLKLVIEATRSYQSKLKHMAYHDQLTGLYSRAMLYEDL